jgi:hypothetical protein
MMRLAFVLAIPLILVNTLKAREKQRVSQANQTALIAHHPAELLALLKAREEAGR